MIHKNSQEISINDLLFDIVSIKKENFGIKTKINNIKINNNSLKQEILCFKIEK